VLMDLGCDKCQRTERMAARSSSALMCSPVCSHGDEMIRDHSRQRCTTGACISDSSISSSLSESSEFNTVDDSVMDGSTLTVVDGQREDIMSSVSCVATTPAPMVDASDATALGNHDARSDVCNIGESPTSAMSSYRTAWPQYVGLISVAADIRI
jgi:hypothetical protein